MDTEKEKEDLLKTIESEYHNALLQFKKKANALRGIDKNMRKDYANNYGRFHYPTYFENYIKAEETLYQVSKLANKIDPSFKIHYPHQFYFDSFFNWIQENAHRMKKGKYHTKKGHIAKAFYKRGTKHFSIIIWPEADPYKEFELCFVDRRTGDIHYARTSRLLRKASPRGNIYSKGNGKEAFVDKNDGFLSLKAFSIGWQRLRELKESKKKRREKAKLRPSKW